MEITRLTFSFLSLLVILMLQRPIFAISKSYVVYFGGHSHGPELPSIELARVTDSHYEFLSSFLGSKEKAKGAIFYSYTRNINGFAANLEDEEAAEISKHPEVVSVFLNKGKKLHTTRSWDFLGLERNSRIPAKSLWKKANFGKDSIIGNLDTGVWPESESFDDEGMGPVPSRWKGFCQNNTKVGVPCNRKLIGARYFNKGHRADSSPLDESLSTTRDINGHGTHTLSTAGGRFVSKANVFGLGNGTAKGGSPDARVAAYKVCWPPINDGPECAEADIVAGFEAAIHDGVDVLSVSVGDNPTDYFSDSIAIGSFHAVKNGIVVVCSAGNEGPTDGSVSNVAPWILTVGASTVDREFTTYVELGDHMQFKGQSLSPATLPAAKKLFPLVNSVDVKVANASTDHARLCYAGSLDRRKVKGKIVVCLRGTNPRVEKGKVVADAGGIGMILVNDLLSGYDIIPDTHVLPTSHISAAEGLSLFSYISSIKSPMAYIGPVRTELNTKPAPSIASFSSRGPNRISPEILKPDVVAPGVSTIAAFTQATGPSNLPFDSRRLPYNSLSGTSMSCPHVSGIVGLLKTLHPDWSPAAIKSALMTTARVQNNMRDPILTSSHARATPFGYGAGHVRPNRAMDPGLVYDLTISDYLNFLCASGYSEATIAKFANENYTCPDSFSLINFNYPSISVPHLNNGSVTVTRTIKNVGLPGTYRVRVTEPAGISVVVDPKSLKFEKIGEEKTFEVTLKAKEGFYIDTDYVFGKLVWSDDVHMVRSPIVVGTREF